MAFATAKTKTVTEVTGVDLSLTKAEAETLVLVLRQVGGDRYNGPRAYTDAIRGQLVGLNIKSADVHVEGSICIDKHGAKTSDSFLTNGTKW